MSDPLEDHGIRVLHVDDEPEFLKSAKEMLGLQGDFQIDTATSVKEALSKLEQESFDAVITDYQMPDRDGLELLKELRDKGARIPFVIFTGKGKEEVAMRALNLGADRYLQKHGDPETVYGELAHSIRKAVERRWMEQALHTERKRLETVTRNMEAGLTVISKDYQILWANQMIKEERGDARDKKCYRAYHGRDQVCPGCGVKEIFETGKKRVVHEKRSTDKQGREIWLEITATPLRDQEGNITSALEMAMPINERKQKERALRESKEQFRRMFEKLGEALVIVALDSEGKGKILGVNQAAVRQTGRTKEELRGSDIHDFLVGDPLDITHRDVTDKLKRGETVSLTAKGRRKDGSTYWTEETVVPFTYRGRKACLAVSRDITQQKKRKQALKESEERYRRQFEESLDAIFLADAETGEILDCNQAATRLVGRTKEELIGRHQRILHPSEETGGKFSRTFQLHRKGKKIHKVEDQVITKNGKIKDVFIKATTFKAGNKKIMQGIFRDITEQKKREDKLRRSEKRLDGVLNNAQDAIVLLNDKGRVDYWNTAAEKMFGYKEEEVRDKEVHRLIAPKRFWERHKKGFAEFKEPGEGPPIGETLQMPAIRKDGTEFPIELSISTVQLEDITHTIATIRDITEREQRDKELRDSLEILAMMNEKLEVVGRLTRHDVRNKLSTITNNAYLTKKSIEDHPEVQKYLEEIKTAVDQANKIFDFAKTYEQLGTQRLQSMDVCRAVEDAVHQLSELKGIKVENHCQDTTVQADQLLPRVFYNLIQNSLQHGGEGLTHIKIYSRKTGGSIMLLYEDNGKGIPEEEKEKIFQEGYGEGTGYGLYLIRKMCEVYGWTIRETGTSGKGAQFTITIPGTKRQG